MTSSSRLLAARRSTIDSTRTRASSFSFNNTSSSSTTTSTTTTTPNTRKKSIKIKNAVSDMDEFKKLELNHNNNEQEKDSLLIKQLTNKVHLVQEAFDTLSDVFVLEMEKMTKKMDTQWKEMDKRLYFLESSFEKIQNQTSILNSRYFQQKEIQDRRFHHTQQAMDLLNQNLSETQAQLSPFKYHQDQIESQQKDMIRLLETLQNSQDQTIETFHKLKQETVQPQQQDIEILKEKLKSTTLALTSDVQVLAKECTSLRTCMSQHMSTWTSKMEIFKENLDRHWKKDLNQSNQKVDTCQDQLTRVELAMKESIQKLYKHHTQIHFAIEESMKINTSEVKTLSTELRALKEVQQVKMDQWLDQLTTHSIEYTKTKERLQCQLQIIAHAFDLSIV